VFLLDLSPERLRRLESQRQGRLVSLVSSRETTHTAPVITRHGVQHYAVGNMPGAVPFAATKALVSVTLPYIAVVAGRGLVDAITDRPELVSGLNTVAGSLCHPGVAKALGLPTRHPMACLS
jgi:alanine dehydrogenase